MDVKNNSDQSNNSETKYNKCTKFDSDNVDIPTIKNNIEISNKIKKLLEQYVNERINNEDSDDEYIDNDFEGTTDGDSFNDDGEY